MRRFLFALALALTIAAPSFAQKIGYVDVQRAARDVEEGKQAQNRLKGEFDKRRADMQKRRQELEKLQADYEKQAPVLSEEAKRKKQEEFQKAYLDSQNLANQMQQELAEKEQEAMSSIAVRMRQVVAEVSRRNNFSYVLDAAVILHGPDEMDVTNEVIRLYNERFGAGAAPKAPDKKAQGAAPKK